MADIPSTWVIGGIFGILALIFLFFVFGREKYPYFAKKSLLTATELNFYKTLTSICHKDFPDLGIAMQVRLADIISCSDMDWQKGYGPKISAKHIDFVLFEKSTTKIITCIELDDSSHNRSDRKRRDIFVNNAMKSAGVSLIRISTADMHDKNLITERIESNLL